MTPPCGKAAGSASKSAFHVRVARRIGGRNSHPGFHRAPCDCGMSLDHATPVSAIAMPRGVLLETDQLMVLVPWRRCVLIILRLRWRAGAEQPCRWKRAVHARLFHAAARHRSMAWAKVRRYARAGNAPFEARISATARSQAARRSGPAGWVSSRPVSRRPLARASVTSMPRALSRSTLHR